MKRRAEWVLLVIGGLFLTGMVGVYVLELTLVPKQYMIGGDSGAPDRAAMIAQLDREIAEWKDRIAQAGGNAQHCGAIDPDTGYPYHRARTVRAIQVYINEHKALPPDLAALKPYGLPDDPVVERNFVLVCKGERWEIHAGRFTIAAGN